MNSDLKKEIIFTQNLSAILPSAQGLNFCKALLDGLVQILLGGALLPSDPLDGNLLVPPDTLVDRPVAALSDLVLDVPALAGVRQFVEGHPVDGALDRADAADPAHGGEGAL